jgi:hypothetical protein
MWTNVSRVDPLARFAPIDDLRAWHENEALTCEQGGLPLAARFHRDRLAALSPNHGLSTAPVNHVISQAIEKLP